MTIDDKPKAPRLLASARQRPRLYKALRSTISPILPGRGGERLIRRLPDGKRILNVGSGPLIYRPDIINIDRDAVPGVKVVGDAESLPFTDGSVDGVICEVTLEHVGRPEEAVAEMIRCLRPGGLLYISVPFLQPLHLEPQDYTRWTLPGVERLAPGLRIVESGVAGGPTATLTWIVAEYVGILLSFGSTRIKGWVSLVLFILLGPLKYIDLLLVRLPTSRFIASVVYVLGEKPLAGGS